MCECVVMSRFSHAIKRAIESIYAPPRSSVLAVDSIAFQCDLQFRSRHSMPSPRCQRLFQGSQLQIHCMRLARTTNGAAPCIVHWIPFSWLHMHQFTPLRYVYLKIAENPRQQHPHFSHCKIFTQTISSRDTEGMKA